MSAFMGDSWILMSGSAFNLLQKVLLVSVCQFGEGRHQRPLEVSHGPRRSSNPDLRSGLLEPLFWRIWPVSRLLRGHIPLTRDLKTQNHLYVSLQDTHCSCWHGKGVSESWPCAGLTSVDAHLISWMNLSLFYQKPLCHHELWTPALVCWGIKTKYHSVGGNQVFSHRSGGLESETQVSAGGLSCTSLLGCRGNLPAFSSQGLCSMCSHPPNPFVCPDFFLQRHKSLH